MSKCRSLYRLRPRVKQLNSLCRAQKVTGCPLVKRDSWLNRWNIWCSRAEGMSWSQFQFFVGFNRVIDCAGPWSLNYHGLWVVLFSYSKRRIDEWKFPFLAFLTIKQSYISNREWNFRRWIRFYNWNRLALHNLHHRWLRALLHPLHHHALYWSNMLSLIKLCWLYETP